jgi:hypothetical protein
MASITFEDAQEAAGILWEYQVLFNQFAQMPRA